MKSRLYYIVMAVCILINSGCSDFLNESDPNSIPSDLFYETEADVRMGANGAYAALRGDGYYKNMYLYTEVRSDNTTQQDPGANGGVLYQFSDFSLMTDNAQVKTHWADLYKCITRTNAVLEAADRISFANESDKKKTIAEMHFLRALTYAHLVFQFGDVPIVTKPLRTKAEIWAHTKRDPKADVYNLIVSDMNVVLQGELPIIQTGNGVGRVSKAAANGLLGKIYLMKAADPDFSAERQANLVAAKSHLEVAWNAKPFTSLKDISYADVFDKDKQATCSEILFQVMYQSGSSSLSSNYNYMFQPTAMTGLTSVRSGSGNNIPTNDMMSEYSTSPLDVRKDISTGVAGGVNFTRKYTDLDDPNGYGGNKWVILRYADIALMLAEVKMHLGEADAAVYLNMVRDRAGLPAYTGTELKEAIRHERRVEFAFEGQRWYDLLRLYTKDELITFLHTKGYTKFSERDLLLPIPYDEHKLDTKRMYQNPGYN